MIEYWDTADVKTCQHGYVARGMCPNCRGWISVKDRLPQEKERVLVHTIDNPFVGVSDNIFIASIIPEINRGITLSDRIAFWYVDESEYLGFSEDEVDFWMPLPAAPEIENE